MACCPAQRFCRVSWYSLLLMPFFEYSPRSDWARVSVDTIKGAMGEFALSKTSAIAADRYTFNVLGTNLCLSDSITYDLAVTSPDSMGIPFCPAGIWMVHGNLDLGHGQFSAIFIKYGCLDSRAAVVYSDKVCMFFQARTSFGWIFKIVRASSD